MEKQTLPILEKNRTVYLKIQEVTNLTLWMLNKPILESGSLYDLWGFDPGTHNLGISWTKDHCIYIAQVTLVRDIDAVGRMKTIRKLLDAMSSMMCGNKLCQLTAIEGASFGDHYRQVELAEQRATVANWILTTGRGTVKIVPPLSIRKKVFGSAKLKAHDVWDNSEIPNDALAAYSCLLYADTLAAALQLEK